MKRFRAFITAVLAAPIRAYQRWISPAIPRRCKYEPTCSAYALEAVREVGPVRGSVLAAWRLLRCNPLSNGGIDEVADRRLFRDRGHAGHSHPHVHRATRAQRAGAEVRT